MLESQHAWNQESRVVANTQDGSYRTSVFARVLFPIETPDCEFNVGERLKLFFFTSTHDHTYKRSWDDIEELGTLHNLSR